jgi:hypothetical protein
MNKRNKTGHPLHPRAHQLLDNRPGHPSKRAAVDIFNDRRREPDRREQSLAIPERMCRRKQDRRINRFNSRPWWLQVNYNDDSNYWT